MTTAVSDHLFTKEMVSGWQHSEKCLAHSREQCICGLTAVQALVEKMGRRTFRVALDHDA